MLSHEFTNTNLQIFTFIPYVTLLKRGIYSALLNLVGLVFTSLHLRKSFQKI